MKTAGQFFRALASAVFAVVVTASGVLAQGNPVQAASPPAGAKPLKQAPWIAVYIGGGAVSDELKASFGQEMLFALTRSGRYRVIESQAEFVANVYGEIERSGAAGLTDGQFAAIARNAKADFVCVVDVSPVLGSYQVLARVADAKTADAVEMGRGIGKIVTAQDVSAATEHIVKSMAAVGEGSMP